ncbi:hypothetical protein P378_04415 [Desulforamulus profundi]|uniref:Uncharacterized protein n=1 Tax=Desulforamulus profundi TaxID=1383067 RepID=A0A2C6MHK6_9FIRM|nr:hypothetical protein [Desulforamulus profundi]MCL4440728.1 hypothetical protein [Bacillota bacterium]MCL5779827.1 hypothetical protein [Bacillota bacterium]PHJ39262.1 hypothetical protein P378_04415 [Desulforamulus profundi]
MAPEGLLEQIKSLPPEDQRFLVNHLLDHLFLEDEDHDRGLYNLDIF